MAVSLLTSRFLFGTALCLLVVGGKRGRERKDMTLRAFQLSAYKKTPQSSVFQSVRGQLLKYPVVISVVKDGAQGSRVTEPSKVQCTVSQWFGAQGFRFPWKLGTARKRRATLYPPETMYETVILDLSTLQRPGNDR
ncbi:hypothetical protein GE21DRAFT_7154 [Neurospora crassa]|uniref:Uncharacterized protein n=2 Tax=Neurospora crassa TaxID=5141 RepID=Q1K667_NEUCR|nr:hypothetical protein NCU04563 [Neurospora crassa OR74A]EAA29426.1 hypothetical protein NCU04563 [Neurospora crassa OR74A]KHE83903.1 hypothetical protein GE21DRAFT_7154 [Neurospora crassa]CAD70759.1 hypothetical protein [Neurospora crassa]|eukprot:XP_958662.1 hypothetical protein NCU04563 [Neurospora crassa OR74A]